MGNFLIIDKESIAHIIREASYDDLILNSEEAFISYSKGRTVIPEVGHLQFNEPPGEVHIKYGYIRDQNYYVVKIASGFYKNDLLGLPSGMGINLIFNQHSGELKYVLFDEGYLTDIRTALAGAVAAKYLAPKKVVKIGVLGTGVQARLQLKYLKGIIACRNVMVWGRNELKLEQLKIDLEKEDLVVEVADMVSEVAQNCNLIITTTASRQPLIQSKDIKPGTHITAVGADSPGKQELESSLLQRANLVVADSISQCVNHGEIHKAFAEGLIKTEKLLELGNIIGTKSYRRQNEDISVMDLTGIASQDIQISNFILDHYPYPLSE
jgi:ornithine cyclodeaminase